MNIEDLDPEVSKVIKKSTPERQAEALQLLEMMSGVTGEPPKVWAGGIIGFGSYHYKYDSGREGDWLLTGFSIRKSALSIYIISGFDLHKTIMQKLGKYKIGKSCLYVKGLTEIDPDQLKQLIQGSVDHIRSSH
ncbi:DUF1801 domain-containing protein [Fulvivirga sp. M361]|uniref:DUF1801 domain-containing protein n=1 Tax=Fulvivirga sp. M361 TaxID=2594266 RepID=UPI00117A15CE|nr:DUF1801 domain-containing protein [Fulvivirga sp. M361]TRX59069.1 DUF1801 domain-containing protein [Fulvivirga sp. M361]